MTSYPVQPSKAATGSISILVRAGNSISNLPDGTPQEGAWSVEEFIEPATRSYAEQGFWENELWSRTDRFRNVAHLLRYMNPALDLVTRPPWPVVSTASRSPVTIDVGGSQISPSISSKGMSRFRRSICRPEVRTRQNRASRLTSEWT